MATVETFLKAFQNENGTFNNISMLPNSNILGFQADFTNPTFSIDISFRLLSDPLVPNFMPTFEQRKIEFQSNFDNLFSINSTDIAFEYLSMGREALSNMLGSISYWHGYSNATGSCLSNAETYLYGPLDLISGVPSRPGFPRGFLWDDGFHNLLIRQFNPDLSLQVR
uniref:mannosyl-oligosaccharide glucosidase n=1 Tax=Panagrolaimus superbus TaxID=310955 RepID=A0A914Z262_9BILA